MDYFHLLADHETLAKFAVFLVVQVLVYLILSKSSSGVFSGAGTSRSASFRRLERSESARRMATLLVEMPRPRDTPSTPAGIQRGGTSNDGGGVDVELELMRILCYLSS
ncbi:hypothetical protein E2562_006248 [Oryza meyeriana var. granulata]|uniref:Uncharacterized protein n=1 Tax=Oryza meyeriana var. granulata TaxID=110450 RepID=A0A6G1CNZ1_9ORYZ|nr:hypothetical protein E2562_006248 [Oryza meyeriana var. granulata]